MLCCTVGSETGEIHRPEHILHQPLPHPERRHRESIYGRGGLLFRIFKSRSLFFFAGCLLSGSVVARYYSASDSLSQVQLSSPALLSMFLSKLLIHMCLCHSQSSIVWYWPKGSDAVKIERLTAGMTESIGNDLLLGIMTSFTCLETRISTGPDTIL